MPPGRQRETGSSFPFCSVRDFLISAAHGWNGGPSLRLDPILRNSLGTCISKQPSGGHPLFLSGSQIPEKSGLPSGVLGVGASRFGDPLGNRGTPGVGYSSHWAARGDATIVETSTSL